MRLRRLLRFPLMNMREKIAKIAMMEPISPYSARPCPSSRRRCKNKNGLLSPGLPDVAEPRLEKARIRQTNFGSSWHGCPSGSLPMNAGAG